MHRTAILALLCAALATLSSQSLVLAVGTPAGTVIPATSQLTYLAGTTGATASASSSVTVAQTAGVSVQTGAAPANVAPGQSYYVSLKTTNTGNWTDSITLSVSSAHSWSTAIIRDDNGDGVHQSSEITIIAGTGSLPADATHACFIQVTVPSSATAADTVTVTAASIVSPSTTAKAAVAMPVPSAHAITFTQAPAVSPTAVASGGCAQCSAAATDSLGHTVSYAWSDGGAGGAFSPSASSQSPAYMAPANSSGADLSVKLSCTATCSQNASVVNAASTSLTVHTATAAVAPVFDPAKIAVTTGIPFLTPHIMLVDASKPSTVSFEIGVPEDLILDTSVLNGSLACIRNGAGVGTLKATWDVTARKIYVNATIPSPSASVEIIGSIAASAAVGSTGCQLTINDKTALDVQIVVAKPGDFNCDGCVNSADVAQFNREWLRSHQTPVPAYSPAIDMVYDLAPRTAGLWPNWAPIGDKIINIQDATAFTECFLPSRSSSLSYNTPFTIYRSFTMIQVNVNSAPYGIYQVALPVPSGAYFTPTLDGNGNLRNVYRGLGAGALQYSEYDPINRIVKITGNVVGSPPYRVAAVYIR